MKKLILFFIWVFGIYAITPAIVLAYNPKTKNGFEYPSFVTVIDDNGRIEIRCKESSKNGQIICTFNQIVVRHADAKSSEDDLRKLKKMNDKDIRDESQKFCQSLNSDNGLNKRLEKRYKDAKSNEERNSVLYFKSVCANPTRATATKWLEDELQKTQTTCTVFSKTYSQVFQYKIDSSQWVAQDEPYASDPMNDCGMITISYLKQDSRKGRSYSWNYITRKIVTNKNGHFFGSSCSELAKGKNSVEKENTAYGAYSNLIESTPFVNCRYIDFASVF